MSLLRFVGFLFVSQMLSIWIPTAQTTDFLTDCAVFYDNSCFNYLWRYKEWSDANTDCVSRGGYLTSINSENENDMLASLLFNATGGSTGANAWIGLDYNRYTQSTNWVDGSPITYSRTPETPGTQYPLCIVITGGGKWRAFSCSDIREYICRRPGGSSFALKRDNGQYESIDGYNTTINSIPTTLVCRTDTYQSIRITWEYQSMQNEQWTDIQGSWNETTGISELNISTNGYYRCHVKSGGSDQLYTATAIDPTITTDTTDFSTDPPTDATNTHTTVPIVYTTSVTFGTKKMENFADYISLPKYQATLGGLVVLIVFLIGIIVALVCIIMVLLVYVRKLRQRPHKFQSIPKNSQRSGKENTADINPGTALKEKNANKYHKMEITTARDSSEYFKLSDVKNQTSAVETHDSEDYTIMLGVENKDSNPTNQDILYESMPEYEYVNIGKVSMDRTGDLKPEVQ